MKLLFGKNKGEEHNFWMSYTDLMSGFLIVFIITSLVAYENGFRDGVKVTEEQFKKIMEIESVFERLHSKYFEYNKEFQRFECKKEILFETGKSDIPATEENDLIEAGKELLTLLDSLISDNVAFKVIIEGRAAQSHREPMSIPNVDMKLLSYNRALSLYMLWHRENIIDSLRVNAEVFISGSGLEGEGRYVGLGADGEDKNKRFIIQIIPYLKFKNEK
jgi:hypothetical protein